MDSIARPTTLEDIESLDKDILVPADVAEYLGVKQHSINCASKAGTLPWAYQMGSRTLIPKQAFVQWHRTGAVVRRSKSLLYSEDNPQSENYAT